MPRPRKPASQERHLVDRQIYKERRSAALAEWQSLMGWASTLKVTALPIGDELQIDWQHPELRWAMARWLLFPGFDLQRKL